MWQRILDYLNTNNITALPTDKGNCVIPQILEDRENGGESVTQFTDVEVTCAELSPF